MRISNFEIAKILHEIAIYLEMDGVGFKPRAYEKAAEVMESLDEEAAEIYKKGGIRALQAIEGVGVSIAEKIEEIILEGSSKYHIELKKKIPVDLENLSRVEGLGPKSIKKLYKELGIKSLEDLEEAAKEGKIRKIEGFGEKSEGNIIKSIGFLKDSGNRFLLGYILPEIEEIKEKLLKVKGVRRVDVVGSARRKKETVGDADILVVSENSSPVMDYFVKMPEVVRVYAHGETKSSARMKNGLDVDVRVVPEESYGAALQYFTGSKEHNVALRELAIKKGYKLNEYGLYKLKNANEKNFEKIAGENEDEIYEKLGLEYIEPELREEKGEIEAAKEKKLPKIIGYEELKGDLQIQTNWSDGANTIEEYVLAAMKLDLEYIAITDHTKRLTVANGLDEKRIIEQAKEIDAFNKKFKNKKFRILKGSEVDILKDGKLDISDDVLKKLDFVGASVHSYFNLPRQEQTRRILKAMGNPNVDIIFHPTGRVINRRPAYDLDMDEIIKEAKRTGTLLEIDAFPDRLDLKDEHIRKCVKAGVKMAIDTDAHSVQHLAYLKWGMAQARRGWAKKSDIINAWPVEKALAMLKKN